jgi:hypothetical protein
MVLVAVVVIGEPGGCILATGEEHLKRLSVVIPHPS